MNRSRANLTVYLLLPLIGIALIALASGLDLPVSTWVHSRGLGDTIKRHKWLQWTLKAPGDFRFTLCVAAAVVALSVKRWVGAALVLLSGILSGLFYVLVKWSIGRTRPFKGVPPFEFHPFRNGWHGLVKAENQSFPSGHACLAFATAEALAILLPKWRVGFYALASVIAAERVLEGAHYPADAIGGAVLGILSAQIARLLLPEPRRARRGFPIEPSDE